MDAIAQSIFQGLLFVVTAGVLGLPFFVWRVPPPYYWRCPRCDGHNPVDTRQCSHCELMIAREEMPRRTRADWRARDLVAIFFVSWVISFMVGMVVLTAMGKLPTDTSEPRTLQALLAPDILWSLELLKSALFAVLCIWMLNGRFRWSLEDIGLHTDDLRGALVMGVGAGAAVFAFGELFELAASLVPVLREERQQVLQLFPTQTSDPLWVLILPTVLALGPLGSEIFFRGMLLRMLRQKRTVHLSVWGAAVAFAVASGSALSFVPLVALGAANGYLFVRSRSLVPGIVASIVQACGSLAWLVLRDIPLGS